MSDSIAQILIDEISPSLREAFTLRHLDSSNPDFRFSAEFWWQLWLVPKSKNSPTLVYECDENMNFADNGRSWLVDEDNREWYEIELDTPDWGWEEIPYTVSRIAREDIVIYKPSEMHPSTEFYVLFELDIPNPGWNATQIRRFKRWDWCFPEVLFTSGMQKDLRGGTLHESVSPYLVQFFDELNRITLKNFNLKIIDGDMTNGKVALIPQNSECLPLQLLVCGGRPLDLLTGGGMSFSSSEILARMEGNSVTSALPWLTNSEKMIFERCIRWILAGAIAIRRSPQDHSTIMLTPDQILPTGKGLKVEMAPNEWWQVVQRWAPW